MKWTERLTAACMVATLLVAVVYQERNYRLSRRSAEVAAEHLEIARQTARISQEYADRQREAFDAAATTMTRTPAGRNSS